MDETRNIGGPGRETGEHEKVEMGMWRRIRFTKRGCEPRGRSSPKEAKVVSTGPYHGAYL